MKNLDSDLLRTFLAITDTGSFLGGAARIFRSQSAASVQIGKLEDLLGAPVFERHGRGISLTPLGEKLEPVARQVVTLLDGTFAELTGEGLEGSLRIGIPDDHSKEVLSRIIADFTREHPKVELTVHCALSTGFSKLIATGALDIAVHEVEKVEPGMVLLRKEKLAWVTSRLHDALDRDPLPIALFDRACWWRDAALKSLQTGNRAYRVVYSSESVTGVAAAIEAGIAIGVLGTAALSGNLRPLSIAEGFHAVRSSNLVIEYADKLDRELCEAMTGAIERNFVHGN
ncbi:LysR family transcriptional regulator [Hoeflea sp. TYP-13]|uniref:LysR family transcriptional regulator n=1 Tax=Hoeflea sp. TYP-13 TaxID=3230023 RepID=UPI0034C5D006